MRFFKTILNIINENISLLKTTKTKPIVDAIKNKQKISFMYTGPLKPQKVAVKPGKRINAEPVAIGLSKKGNLIIRAWVGPPSVSKKGFDKTNWRTFIVGRMSNIQINDETFDLKPGFKPKTDKSMSVTYVTSDLSTTKQVKPQTQIKPIPTKVTPKVTKTVTPPKPKPTPPQKPEDLKKELPKPETAKTELPQPKPSQKPEKTPSTQKPETSKKELPQPKQTKKPDKSPDVNKNDEMEPLIGLSEAISRIKTLILY